MVRHRDRRVSAAPDHGALFVYAAGGPSAPAAALDGPTLAGALRAAGVARLYADHGWSSRVALAAPEIGTMPANLALDAYGFVGAPTEFLPEVRWAPGSGALLEPPDAAGFADAARAGGLGLARREVGGLVLFTYAPPRASPGTPLSAAALRVTTSRESERAALAVDGDPKTRWATARPQTPGDWVRIEVASPRAVPAVRLWTAHPADSPRGLALEAMAASVKLRVP